MINITNKVDCCGCQACGDICAKKAISFKADEEGIWYPVVDKDKCVDCGLCEKMCPIINRTSCPTNKNIPECYVLQAPDANDRLLSASGAAYTLLARVVFEQGGVVAGHVWDESFGVKGYVSVNPEDLNILRGTKYLQSDVEGIYITVKKLLKEGKLVLFSGTPCQNAAMRSFLRKDYDNLIMTDFVCMGIDSPLAFKKYIESLETQYHSKIVYFKAKAKEVGWRHLTNKAIFENGKTYFGINGQDANLKATFLDVLVRPSCYDCKFKGFPRVSDLTIGDYWRRKYDYDPLDDNTGTSYVMLHNHKAVNLFEKIKPYCIFRNIEFQEILEANKFAVQSLSQPLFDRREFYERLHHEDFKKLVNDYSNQKSGGASFIIKMKKGCKELIRAMIYYKRNPLSFLQFLYYNFLSHQVDANIFKGNLFIPRNTTVHIEKGAHIKVNGYCVIDGKYQRSSIVLDRDSELSLDCNLIGFGTHIHAESKASISLGFMSQVNNNVALQARTGISIGEFSVINDCVRVDDTNNGILYFNEESKKDRTIEIGTHCLLNKGCVIKGGATLRDETIVNEFAIVDGTFNPRVILSGNPAQVIKDNINWKHNFENIWNYKS